MSTLLPIALVVFLFWLYIKWMCGRSGTSAAADLICGLNWKDGVFLVASYGVVKFLSPLLSFDTITKRLILTLFLYSFSFALMALPYWLASFGQQLPVNVFLHISIVILVVEFAFGNDKQTHSDGMRTTQRL